MTGYRGCDDNYTENSNHPAPPFHSLQEGIPQPRGQLHRESPPLCISLPLSSPRSEELRTQKLKSQLVRTQSLNVLPLRSGVGQYVAIHATLTARNFFLAYFYPSNPFTCVFVFVFFFPKKISPDFFLRWLWLTPFRV